MHFSCEIVNQESQEEVELKKKKSMMVNRCLVSSCNPNYRRGSGSIPPEKKNSCCLQTKKNVLLGEEN